MTCRHFTARLADYLDGALPQPVVRAVGQHADRCGSCRAYLAQYRATKDAVAALAEWDDVESDDLVLLARRLTTPASARVN